MSRQTSDGQGWGTISRSFDLAGRMTRTTWQDGFYVDYDRLVTGELWKARENGASSGVGVLATYSYDDLRRRTGVTFGNAAAQTLTYDAVSRLASLSNDLSGTTNDLSVTFAYNPASQITQAVRTGDAYAYTAMGNGSTAFTQNGLNQQITVGGSSTSHDSNGNLTTEPQSGKTYAYDAENKLTSSSGGTGTALAYDPTGRLDTYNPGSTRRFIHDGGETVAELDSSGAIQERYVLGDGADELLVDYSGSGTTNRRFAGLDERGSIVSLTDSSGTLVGINAYDEYGKPAASNVGRMQYTGQMWLPEANLYYYKARNYAPQLGRFVQTDPIGPQDSANLYQYALNDPLNLIDPSGQNIWLEVQCSGLPASAGGNESMLWIQGNTVQCEYRLMGDLYGFGTVFDTEVIGGGLSAQTNDPCGYVQLPQNPQGAGYYTYGTPGGGKGQFGLPDTIGLIEDIARQWGGDPIGIGNISLNGGGPFPPHTSHSSGTAFDVRPVRSDSARIPTTWTSPGYSRSGTQRLVDSFLQSGRVKGILFNDPAIKGVKPWPGHNNHLHVSVRTTCTKR